MTKEYFDTEDIKQYPETIPNAGYPYVVGTQWPGTPGMGQQWGQQAPWMGGHPGYPGFHPGFHPGWHHGWHPGWHHPHGIWWHPWQHHYPYHPPYWGGTPRPPGWTREDE